MLKSVFTAMVLAISVILPGFIVIAASVFPGSLRATELTRGTAHDAGVLYAYILGNAAILNKCSNIDMANEPIYEGVSLDYIKENASLMNKITNIFMAAAAAEGRDINSIVKEVRDRAVAIAQQLHDENPNAFLATCRNIPKMFSEHAGPFMHLRDRYPAEVQDIENWR
ncbi:hypothetical protein FRZ44_33420 [Hypericibacter terrae]|uniref:Uncharacterized protein n=1 Tax=Hypericibacter terrae TaxID=2602015 RepID=A0A5J6MKK3_9PROT|nr:hypothetical protein [Hypericibacter terrae]QEX18038.1 hypothetical protein FRZ44_33420 [Hypericibacter terrae]